MSLLRPTSQVSLGRTTAAKTFTRNNNKTVEPRNAGQARTKRIATNQSRVAYFKRPLVLACTFVLTLLAFSASPAFASRAHEFTGTFGGGPCALEPCGENLKEPDGVAVNEATKDVYVVDRGANRVVRYSSAGKYESEFNGSGTLLNDKNETFEGKAAGSGPGEVATGRFEEPSVIAVDNSCVLQKPALTGAACTSFDPSDGDVYVVDAGNQHRVIDKYSPEGMYLGQISEAAGKTLRSESLEGVAVDSTGTVWIDQEGKRVSKFSNATPNAFLSPQVGVNGLENEALPGLAVDAQRTFYIRVGAEEGGHILFSRIAKAEASGTLLTAEVDGEESSAVAVDQTNNNVVIDNLTSIAVFNSGGTLLERLGEEKGEHHLTEGAGVGIDAGTSTIYAVDAATDKVVEFGPQLPTTPAVESDGFSNVTSQGATLEAQINPRNEPLPAEGETSYRFEYRPCATVEPSSCEANGFVEVPGSAGQIAPDYNGHPVTARVEGLSPHATYQFEVLAENKHGKGEPGEAQMFTTEAAGGELVLPDNRGYELVSPPDKQGALVEPLAEAGVVQAAASGQAITYLTNAPTETQPSGLTNEMQVVSRRGGASWSSGDIGIPHTSATGFAVGPGPEYKFFDPELTLSAVQPFGEFIPQLSAEASESTAYLHDLSEGCGSSCYRPLVTGKAGFANVPAGTEFGEEQLCKVKTTGTGATHVFCGPEFLGASEDLSHVALSSAVPLLSGAVAQELYEWSAGALAPVSVLPGGAPAEGKLGLGESQAARGAISSDGNRIVWSSTSALYLRDMARGETVQLDRAEEVGGVPCGGCTSGGGQFQIASSDGSRVFFTDTSRLTEDSGSNHASSPAKADLYECRIVLTPKLSCELSDVTPVRGSESAEVQLGLPNNRGGILGAGEDGEQVYFVANGIQSGLNGEGKRPAKGQPNLYVHEAGGNQLVATLSSGDEHDWLETLIGQPTRVSPNGQYLEFMSQTPLRGYDNRDVASGEPAAEVYIYDASAKKLRCASCMPSGQRPVGVGYHKLETGSGGLVGGYTLWPEKALVAANVPGWTAIGTGTGGVKERYQPRYLSNEGRLFFNSADALVPQDSNGTQDVYEYEPPGVGSCSEASETFSARSGGCVSLISSGASTQESAFLDASESGDDVFFLTSAKLSPLDVDASVDVYDAHVCSGASPCIAYGGVQSPPCTTEASCKASPTPQPSIFGAPSSATFQGPGNLTPAAAVKAKAKPLTRAQKLAAALKACKKFEKKSKRLVCEKRERKKYGAKKAKKAKPKQRKK
jgi:DNA-binding beta-propeller fold protein YncE